MSYEQKSDTSEWLGKKGIINEVLFCKEFTELHPMKYIDEKFITIDGEISLDKVSAQIGDMLIRTGIPNLMYRPVRSILRLVQRERSVKSET